MSANLRFVCDMRKQPDILSTNDIGKLIPCSPKVVAAWFDSGLLKGWRVPGSKYRRTNWKYFAEFLRENNMDWILRKCEAQICAYGGN